MVNRALIAGFLCGLLVAYAFGCGGGGGGEPPRVAILGDSIASSTFTLPDGSVGRLAVPSVQRINELAAGRFTALDYAMPGMIAAEAVSGGYRWMEYGPNAPLAEALKTTPAQTVVFRYGTADALRGIGPDLFRVNLRDLIRITRAAGKTPVLVEPIHQAPSFAEKADVLRAVVIEVAAAEGVQLIPVRDLPWTLIDGVHPDQATADLMAARIAQNLLAREPGNE